MFSVERSIMIDQGKITLYLTDTGKVDYGAMGMDKPNEWRIGNWDDSFSIKTFGVPRKFRHPFSRQATIVYFPGPDGHVWSARNIGDNDIAHCRRLKEKWRKENKQ
jgi:hypothetical protein